MSPDIPLIHSQHRKWRPVALADVSCVAYLNRLFRAGWGLVPFDMDGIDWMLIDVPVKTPRRVREDMRHIWKKPEESLFVAILRFDGIRDGFRAVLRQRNAEGYFDYRATDLDKSTWRSIISSAIDERSMCEIFQRIDSDTP